MLDRPLVDHCVASESRSASCTLLADELDFYESYDWCLNPHLTADEAVARLGDELGRFETALSGWQTTEVAANVYLLACGILNCVDEYLRGPSLRLPGRLGKTVPGRYAGRLIEALHVTNWRRLAKVRQWRRQWVADLQDFLCLVVKAETVDRAAFAESGSRLARFLQTPLPPDLGGRYLNVPSPFRRLDMSQQDVLAMGRCLIERMPERSRELVLVGLRTSGTYFAPLLKAQLETEGYAAVSYLTIEPNKGAGHAEFRALQRHAAEGSTAVMVDDPPDTGGTVYTALSIARRAGFTEDRLRILVPAHPSRRQPFAEARDDLVIRLDPERWYKRLLLQPKTVKSRLSEYFAPQNLTVTRVTASGGARVFNDRLEKASVSGRGSHLKRVFEVRLQARDGKNHNRYVLAKSSGWGWLGYHAFLAGHRLAGRVPPILGLRDGIIYMEWIAPPGKDRQQREDRHVRINTAATYVAARTCSLGLASLSEAGMDLNRQNNGIRLLEKALSRAYGRFLTDTLRRPRLATLLRRQPCPVPTFIDGNMHSSEWVADHRKLLKTDYEHHGMGKAGLNVTDPAFDLADAMLDLELTQDEQATLVRRYREESGDANVDERLFLNKLLAGIWNMNQAQEELFTGLSDAEIQQRAHQRFLRAWNFLTIETARHCGSLQSSLQPPAWRGPLLALDVDGVIDRRRFGFPCTTAAGITALSLLNAHDISVVLNTARSLPEVKDYCAAYALCGGIAEHGAYIWDAVAGHGQVLISDETQRQLETLRQYLRKLPAVFLDERHRYSIRAFTYRDKPSGLVSSLVQSMKANPVGDGAVAPLPGLLINRAMAELGLDRLSFHHTLIDTTIVARETDTGTGLTALRDRALGCEAQTIAVGDSKPDLAMFRVATRSFAPSNISCANQAQQLGCVIVNRPFQCGLLDIARMVIGSDDPEVPTMTGAAVALPPVNDLFFDLLQEADRSPFAKLMAAMADPQAYRIFLR